MQWLPVGLRCTREPFQSAVEPVDQFFVILCVNTSVAAALALSPSSWLVLGDVRLDLGGAAIVL